MVLTSSTKPKCSCHLPELQKFVIARIVLLIPKRKINFTAKFLNYLAQDVNVLGRLTHASFKIFKGKSGFVYFWIVLVNCISTNEFFSATLRH